MGLDIHRYHAIQLPEHGDPIHNMGYLRSSYNDGGFNNVCHNMNLPDLYNIFSAASGKHPDDIADMGYVWCLEYCLDDAIALAKETLNGMIEKGVNTFYVEYAKTVVRMLQQMQEFGYGMLLSWSA